jgi:exodeoxyribonuclease VII large subunit
LRAPTPSAAAEIAVPDSAEIKKTIANLYKQSLTGLRKNIEYKRRLIDSFTLKSPDDVLNIHRLKIDGYIDKMLNSANTRVNEVKSKLAICAGKLDALSPLKVLDRGFSITKKDGIAVKSINHVKKGDELEIILTDGEILVEVGRKRQKQELDNIMTENKQD